MSASQSIPTSAFAVVASIHLNAKLRLSATLGSHSESPRKRPPTKSSQPAQTVVDTTSKTLSSFMRHKMRKFPQVGPEYVRKLMSTNVIKAQAGLATEGNIDTPEPSPRNRPRTCATSVRLSKPMLRSYSPEKPLFQRTLRTGLSRTHNRKRLAEDYEKVIQHCSVMLSPSRAAATSIEKQRSTEKMMMKTFFSTVKLIGEIECRHLRHLPEIYNAKIESNESYLQDAQNISVEYRKGISDPTRFVGRIERKRWGRLKIKPQVATNFTKEI